MSNSFRDRLKQHDLIAGTLVTLPCPSVAEILADSGFDWLFLDMEHGPLDVHVVQSILQAVDRQVACLVRVPINDETWIKRVLDLGVSGIIVPQIRTPADAEQAVAACRYPPRGRRGVGVARAQRYGAQLAEYLATANDRIAVVIQIEHIDAVQAIDEILAVEGIDAALIGPFDLSASMGKIGQVQDPEVQAAIEHVRQACQRHGVASGIFTATAEAASAYIDQGFRLIAIGTDTLFLGQAARSTVHSVHTSRPTL